MWFAPEAKNLLILFYSGGLKTQMENTFHFEFSQKKISCKMNWTNHIKGQLLIELMSFVYSSNLRGLQYKKLDKYIY